METHKEVFDKANQNILDCFGGSDGGIRYFKYLSVMRDFADQADDGNRASGDLVEIARKFSNLIDVLNR